MSKPPTPGTAQPRPTDLDQRYTFGYEYVGAHMPRHVARFCGSWIGHADSLEAAHTLARQYEANRWTDAKPDPFAADYNSANPIVMESTPEGRTDGVRCFERKDGTTVIYNPRLTTVPEWEKTTGHPLPPFPATGVVDPRDLQYYKKFTSMPRMLKPELGVKASFTLSPGDSEKLRAELTKVRADRNGATFIIAGPSGDGPEYRIPFDKVVKRIETLIQELHASTNVKPGEDDPMDVWRLYCTLMEEARRKHEATGWQSACDLTPELIPFENQVVRAMTPELEPRQFTVRRTTGFMPCHMESTSHGQLPALPHYTQVFRID